MKKREPRSDRKVVPIAEATEHRRKKAARKSRNEAMASIPDDPDAAGHFTMLGNMALIEGSFEDAIEPFSRALALAPDDVDARAGRGRAYQGLGEYALALADFDRATKLAPDQSRHHLDRARALAMLGRMKPAVQAASRAIELAPDSAGAHYTRAVYRSHVDEEDPGVGADLARAVELAPHELPYLRAHIDHLMNAEEWDLALVDLDRAVAIAPDDGTLHDLRGQCLSRPLASIWNARTGEPEFDDAVQPRCEAALAAYSRALELVPKESELYGHILFDMIGPRECMPDEAACLAAVDRALVAMPDDMGLLGMREQRRRRLGDVDGAAADRKRLEELGWKE
jgi:tetratricopeptide (TPR) repeat protein